MFNLSKKDSVAEEVAKILAQEAELSDKQKKIAKIAGDKEKIDAADLAALRAGKKPVEEGFDDMEKYLKDKNKPQPSGGAGKKQGSKYGGSKQKEEEPKEDMKEDVESVDEKAPPGFEGTVKAMKKHKEIDNPFALAWSMKNKGYKSHKKADGSMKKEEVEELDEKEGHGSIDPLAARADYAKRHGTGQVYKKTYPGDKTGMSKAYAYDIKRTGPKGKLPEEVESLDELKKSTLGSYINKAAKDQSNDSFDHGEDEHRQYGTPGEDPERDKDLEDRERRMSNREKGIGRAVKKLSKEEFELDEAVSRKHFQQVADLIKTHDDAGKRKELAQHHAEIFKQQNPRFDHAKFMKAAGVNEDINKDRTKDMISGRKPTKQTDDVGPGSDGKSTKAKLSAESWLKNLKKK